jgi:Family of unknown function (DUF5990)
VAFQPRGVDHALIEEAMHPERRLVARVRLTDTRGNPIYARLRPPDIAWSVERARIVGVD